MGELRKTQEKKTDLNNIAKHCNRCQQYTNHEVPFQKTVHWAEDYEQVEISGGDSYALIQCLGCDTVRLLHKTWFSEDWDPETGTNVVVKLHPASAARAKPDWAILAFSDSMNGARKIFDEIYEALSVGALRLAVMGIRALVEQIMIDKVGDKGSFEKNISAFFEAGYVAQFQQEAFKESLIEAGHATMHRAWQPSKDDMSTLLDVLEGLVKAIYIDTSKATAIGKRIPKRPKRDRNKSNSTKNNS